MKINNYLLGFGGILVFLTVGHFLVVFKYFQILIHHGLYYCREMAKALNLGLPGDLGKAVFGLLLLAAIFTLIRFMGTIFNIYFYGKFLSKTSVLPKDKLKDLFEKLNLQAEVRIIDQSRPSAFCFGVFYPKIYISTGLLKLMSLKELAVILRHEQYHLEHRDTLILFLAAIVESLFPFFPIISDLIKIYRTDREVMADQLAASGPAEKQSLALVLKKLLQSEPVVNPAFMPGIISVDTIEARIKSLLALKISYKIINRKKLFASLVPAMVLIGLMFSPVKAIEIHDSGQDIIVLCPLDN